jgi:hypothetical protein
MRVYTLPDRRAPEVMGQVFVDSNRHDALQRVLFPGGFAITINRGRREASRTLWSWHRLYSRKLRKQSFDSNPMPYGWSDEAR